MTTLRVKLTHYAGSAGGCARVSVSSELLLISEWSGDAGLRRRQCDRRRQSGSHRFLTLNPGRVDQVAKYCAALGHAQLGEAIEFGRPIFRNISLLVEFEHVFDKLVFSL